ncbi:MAG TPA: hypothetical protein VH186_22050 [Chloroflexia bacterium]|nr:hypothetical protein [Chloroflexia bacterium]
MSELRADLAGFGTTAQNIEQDGAAVVKQLQAIREKIVTGSRSFFVANRGDDMRSKADKVFSEAIDGVDKFYKSLADGIRTEKANIERVDSV